MSRSSQIGTALVGAAAVLLLAACGSSAGDAFAAQSAKKISAQTEKDMKALRSLTFDAAITQDGEKLHVKLSSDRDGNCAGTVGFGGVSGDLLRIDGAEYLRGDEAFWTKAGGADAKALVALLGDRWAKLAGASEFASFCDLDELFKEIDQQPNDAEAVKGAVTKVDGREAVEITTKENGGTLHAWVATEGKHYILRIEQVGGTEPGVITFSGFDEPVVGKAPAKGEFVDLGTLG